MAIKGAGIAAVYPSRGARVCCRAASMAGSVLESPGSILEPIEAGGGPQPFILPDPTEEINRFVRGGNGAEHAQSTDACNHCARRRIELT